MALFRIPHVGNPSKDRRSKYVVAHFMVGNTYPYTKDDWKEDIHLAAGANLDAFALNVGSEDWQLERVNDAFQAALESSLNFKLFMSFDMASIPSSNNHHIQRLETYVERFANHPNYMLFDNRALVSTFAGENARFGFEQMEEAWHAALKKLNVHHSVERSRIEIQIFFLPAFFLSPIQLKHLKIVDGIFNWNGGWPIHLKPDSPPDEIHCPKLLSDQEYFPHLHGKAFMSAVSPWFFTHYGPDSWNKNWIYRGDDWLFARRWEQIIHDRKYVDIVQVISWNDYGESHYIGPIKGAQPNSETWVNGYPHIAWLHLNAYYAKTFKDGVYSPVDKERIFMWARSHSKFAEAPDAVPKPDNWQLVEDDMWVIVFAKTPAEVVLSSLPGDEVVVRIHPGISKLRHPLKIGRSMSVSLMRSGKIVLTCNAPDYFFNPNPPSYNFNAFVCMSPTE